MFLALEQRLGFFQTPENAFENLRQETMVRFPVDLRVSSLVWVPVT